MNATPSTAPIGVFDSGIGGLSILQALRNELPLEDFVYVADTSHAPYGERDDGFVIERSRTITQALLDHYGIKALVVACNTATAAAIHLLRQQFPALSIIGVEPALKPAAQTSQTHRVGVLATRGTLASAKFGALLASLVDQTKFVCQPCDGLASAIEAGDAPRIEQLCSVYLGAMGHFGRQPGAIDTLVLGCTHYPLAADALRRQLGTDVHLLDSGGPVARQTRRVLETAGLLRSKEAAGTTILCATGDTTDLAQAGQRWLLLSAPIRRLPLDNPD